eukprot:CAMPEP_0172482908 /NCGR_PEP_ID=MMETSP1066-20121228/9614_1 /TAXON_ID=671091 /ORGANISM="Coscinodiscus wailesii, Strain CCMP2513" /LENGTH=631 /DNA_ID=CAMNT_0013246433 /DNA_START=74 /DNA_END=1969 /DNA_ORIENTATION=+
MATKSRNASSALRRFSIKQRLSTFKSKIKSFRKKKKRKEIKISSTTTGASTNDRCLPLRRDYLDCGSVVDTIDSSTVSSIRINVDDGNNNNGNKNFNTSVEVLSEVTQQQQQQQQQHDDDDSDDSTEFTDELSDGVSSIEHDKNKNDDNKLNTNFAPVKNDTKREVALSSPNAVFENQVTEMFDTNKSAELVASASTDDDERNEMIDDENTGIERDDATTQSKFEASFSEFETKSEDFVDPVVLNDDDDDRGVDVFPLACTPDIPKIEDLVHPIAPGDDGDQAVEQEKVGIVTTGQPESPPPNTVSDNQGNDKSESKSEDLVVLPVTPQDEKNEMIDKEVSTEKDDEKSKDEVLDFPEAPGPKPKPESPPPNTVPETQAKELSRTKSEDPESVTPQCDDNQAIDEEQIDIEPHEANNETDPASHPSNATIKNKVKLKSRRKKTRRSIQNSTPQMSYKHQTTAPTRRNNEHNHNTKTAIHSSLTTTTTSTKKGEEVTRHFSDRATITETPQEPVANLKNWLMDFERRHEEHRQKYIVKNSIARRFMVPAADDDWTGSDDDDDGQDDCEEKEGTGEDEWVYDDDDDESRGDCLKKENDVIGTTTTKEERKKRCRKVRTSLLHVVKERSQRKVV